MIDDTPILPADSLPARPTGLSAFVRCKNEEEFLRASLVSIDRFVDEIVIVFNDSSDGSRAIAAEIAARRQDDLRRSGGKSPKGAMNCIEWINGTERGRAPPWSRSGGATSRRETAGPPDAAARSDS